MFNDFRRSSRITNPSNFMGIQIMPPSGEISSKDCQSPTNYNNNNNNNGRIQIFARTKSHKKNTNIFQGITPSNSNLNIFNHQQSANLLARRKSRTIHGFDNDLEEIIIKEIYKIKEDEEVPKLIQKFMKIKQCSILKYGLKTSNENIDFSFCRTCDPNLINPICAECIKECHQGHKYKKKFMIGQIKCICGERLHCMSKKLDLNIGNGSCELGEWYTISKLNFYYKTKDKKCYCMLCYNFCNNDKSKESIYLLKSEKNENDKANTVNIPNCCCNNEDVHQERKSFFEKMEEIAHNIDYFEYFKLLHPSQIINMIFLSKHQFKSNYSDLNNLIEIILSDNFAESSEFNFFKKSDFSATNNYFIFNHLIEFIKLNKHTNIAFYCQEAKDFFSFERAQLILSLFNNMRHNEKSFWILSSKFLELFHKIYVGNLTQSFSKFKLNDLENFSCGLRWLCCNINEKNTTEYQKIINYLISILKNINLNGFSCVEALDLINIIIIILKKFSLYNLISNGDMMRIIQEVEKMFSGIKILRKTTYKNNQSFINFDSESIKSTSKAKRSSLIIRQNIKRLLYDKEIKFYYNTIKLIMNFNISFNDRLVYNAITNNHKFPILDSINKDTVLFTFIKTDLGRALIKLTIKVLYTIRNFEVSQKKDSKINTIMNWGINILSSFIQENDAYLLNIIQSLKQSDFYIKGIDIDKNTNIEYKEIVEENYKIEKCYKKFFIFEADIDNVIKEVNNSLGKVLGDLAKIKDNKEKKIIGLKDNKNICILRSNYYFTLSKFYQILNFSEKKNEYLPNSLKDNGIIKENEELISNVIDKIFLFYQNFIYNSYDNSLLLLSNYILKDLCKVPIKYGLNNFELFLEAIKNIINNSNLIGNINNYLKNLFLYLEYLKQS